MRFDITVASAVAFLGIVGVSVLITGIPLIIFVGYLGLSLISFILFALDKRAARQGRWRTQESTLHLFSLAGGWPGALVARHYLRHKTVKQPFVTYLYVMIMVNSAAFIWLNTADGNIFLTSVFNQFPFLVL